MYHTTENLVGGRGERDVLILSPCSVPLYMKCLNIYWGRERVNAYT